ncbi:hypothetical protein Hanom_Chr11g01051201 [Helianthus anomalus]
MIDWRIVVFSSLSSLENYSKCYVGFSSLLGSVAEPELVFIRCHHKGPDHVKPESTSVVNILPEFTQIFRVRVKLAPLLLVPHILGRYKKRVLTPS